MRHFVLLIALLTAAVSPAAQVTATHGRVSIQRPDGSSALAAAGDVMRAGDRIVTAAKADALIQVDSVNEFEAGPGTEVFLVESDEQHHEIQLVRGSVMWRVYGSASPDVALETPNVRVRPVFPGEYALTARDGLSEIAAFHGEIEVYAPQGSELVRAGRKMWARGPASQPEFRMGNAFPWWRRAVLALGSLSRAMNVAGAGGSVDSSDSSSASSSASSSSGGGKTEAAHADSPRAGTASHTSGSPSPGPPPGRR